MRDARPSSGNQRKIKMTNTHGGRRVGSGRPLGSVNRATVDAKARLSELAKQHCVLALEVLASIAENGQSETARIAAACALLDRGFGKPREAGISQYADPDDGPFGWLR
jgi:hypothetical protein